MSLGMSHATGPNDTQAPLKSVVWTAHSLGDSVSRAPPQKRQGTRLSLQPPRDTLHTSVSLSGCPITLETWEWQDRQQSLCIPGPSNPVLPRASGTEAHLSSMDSLTVHLRVHGRWAGKLWKSQSTSGQGLPGFWKEAEPVKHQAPQPRYRQLSQSGPRATYQHSWQSNRGLTAGLTRHAAVCVDQPDQTRVPNSPAETPSCPQMVSDLDLKQIGKDQKNSHLPWEGQSGSERSLEG